jgi:hypothetical protein
MNSLQKSTHLTNLCDQTLAQLTEAMRLVKEVRDGGKGRRTGAARCLESMSKHIAYRGETLCLNMDEILAEVEELDVDETFGPRQEVTVI